MGADKASLPFGPELLLVRVVRQVGDACGGPIVVVAARDQDVPPLPSGALVVRDPSPDGGPLPALGVALRALPADVALCYSTSTDAPWLAPGWVDHLVSCLGEDADAAVVVGPDDDRPHPLAAVYRVEPARAAVEELVQAGRSRLRDLLDAVRTRRVDAGAMRAVDPNLRTLRNLNTPEDYRAAVAELAAGTTGRGDRSDR